MLAPLNNFNADKIRIRLPSQFEKQAKQFIIRTTPRNSFSPLHKMASRKLDDSKLLHKYLKVEQPRTEYEDDSLFIIKKIVIPRGNRFNNNGKQRTQLNQFYFTFKKCCKSEKNFLDTSHYLQQKSFEEQEQFYPQKSLRGQRFLSKLNTLNK